MTTIDEAIKSKFPNDHIRSIVNILYTANWLKNHHNEFLREYQITAQQYNILRILRGAKDWLPMTEVKCRMIEKSPNTTRLADKLLEQKLLERKRSSKDRRVVYVKTTSEGLQLLDDIDKRKGMEPSEKVFSKITEEEARQLSALLDRIRN